MQKTSNLGI